MALAATIEWDVRTSGDNTNGGGFKPGASGTDLTQQDAAQYSVTDAVTAGTTTITSATANFGTDVVGNVLYITGGTGSVAADWYEITARTNSTTITVDRSTGLSVGTGATLKIGGAIKTLTTVATEVVAGNVVHVKAGTYGETLTISVSGGNGTQIIWNGYNATHGDVPTGTNRPLIDGASTRANCLVIGATFGNTFDNLRFTGGTGAGVTLSTGAAAFRNCRSYTNGTHGFAGTGTSGISYLLLDCEADGNTGSGLSLTGTNATIRAHGCNFHDNGSAGIAATSSNNSVQVISLCLFDSNVASGAALFTHSVLNCTAYGNSGATADGFSWAGNLQHHVFCFNCISASNGRDGFRRGSATVTNVIFDYNDYDANGGADLTNITAGAHDSSADPGFTNAGAGDFSIGTTLKALGWPGLFPGGLSTGYLDIGAVQRQEAGSGGGLIRHPGMNGGANA